MLADASGKHQPIEWAKIAIAAYRAHRADRIVAERNNGGAMGVGHEDLFTPLQLRARYRFFHGKHANTREAPKAVTRTS